MLLVIERHFTYVVNELFFSLFFQLQNPVSYRLEV